MQFPFIISLLIIGTLFVYLKPGIKRARAVAKGKLGELKVQRILKRLPRRKYKIFNDVLIGNGGRYSQIDHVIISQFGIFIIETKNYNGWLFGSDRYKYWTQTLGRKKFKIYNPVWQNNAHVRAMKSLGREFSSATYHPIVVFAGNAKLKKIDTQSELVYIRNIRRHLKLYREKALSEQQVARLVNGLIEADKSSNATSVRLHKEHIESRKMTQSSNEFNCPSCGSELVKRFGKHGEFMGCSSYPRCRYTRNV
ncbi:MAG: NERD domain-containing protein [Flavobacteriia bacterium]|nr:NERD domain-containing protein [Flavobacteriia bacterium]